MYIYLTLHYLEGGLYEYSKEGIYIKTPLRLKLGNHFIYMSSAIFFIASVTELLHHCKGKDLKKWRIFKKFTLNSISTDKTPL